MDNGLCLLYICVVSKLLTRKTQKPGRGERKNTRHGRGTDDGKKPSPGAVDNRVMRDRIYFILVGSGVVRCLSRLPFSLQISEEQATVYAKRTQQGCHEA